MLSLWIIESRTAQVLFSYPKSSNGSSRIMQLVTPIILGQRVFREELHFEAMEVRVGANVLLVSSHLDRYTLMVKGDAKAYIELKAFRKAACDLINLLCGPCWHHLKTSSSCNDSLSKCIEAVQRLHTEQPHLSLGFSSRHSGLFCLFPDDHGKSSFVSITNFWLALYRA